MALLVSFGIPNIGGTALLGIFSGLNVVSLILVSPHRPPRCAKCNMLSGLALDAINDAGRSIGGHVLHLRGANEGAHPISGERVSPMARQNAQQ